MNKMEMKEWRSIQIAATILYRLSDNIKIETVNNVLYNFKVIIQDYNLSFAIKVASSSFTKNVSYKTYLEELKETFNNNCDGFIPIILMCVNESTETAMWGFQVGWLYNKPIIFDKVKFMTSNEKSWNLINDHIKSMDNTIRILSIYGMKIMKSLEIAIDYNQQTFKAEIVYFRDFSDLYKIKQTSYKADKERFYKLLNSIPEEEFPVDDLDNMIYQCISSKYHIVNTRSRLMISTFELRNLQHYKNSIHKKGNIVIEPDQILPMLDGMYIPHIGIDIFPYLPIAADIFSDISITYTIPIANWIECYSKIIADIKTLHNIEEFLQ